MLCVGCAGWQLLQVKVSAASMTAVMTSNHATVQLLGLTDDALGYCSHWQDRAGLTFMQLPEPARCQAS